MRYHPKHAHSSSNTICSKTARTYSRSRYIILYMCNIIICLLTCVGVGKSVIVKETLNLLQESKRWVSIILIFSAQSTSSRTQEILEQKLEKKKRILLGAPIGKRVCIFVDDVNMPRLDTYGSQPAIELLRY